MSFVHCICLYIGMTRCSPKIIEHNGRQLSLNTASSSSEEVQMNRKFLHAADLKLSTPTFLLAALALSC